MVDFYVKKRLFLGIPLPVDLTEELKQWQLNYQVQNGIKWTRSENFHITLCFIGETPAEIIENLKGVIHIISRRVVPFSLKFNHLYLAPNKRDARMIWVKYFPHPTFKALAKQFSQLFVQLSIQHKSYLHPIPHITLARFKANTSIDLKKSISSHQIKVEELILWESILYGNKRIYTPLKTFSLKKNNV